MKKILFITCLLSSFTCYAQKGITFTVEKLSKPEKILQEESSEYIYEKLISSDKKHFVDKTKNEGISVPDNIVAKSNLPDNLVTFGYHSFFNGMYQAYADHRPFVLSPDMIWLLISQGFARHVNANAEELRPYFVDHSGKLSLIVASNSITLDNPDSPWEEVFPEFKKQIAAHTGEELIDLLSADFSTTTPTAKVASEITIMEAMEPYFEYIVMYIVCGIPEITLQGTTEDWQNILDKTKRLAEYDLNWWTSELEPVLYQFVEASKGKIDKAFWRNMFKYHTKEVYGKPKVIDGWVVKFFPYDNKGKRNNLEQLTSSESLPEEIVKVDLKYFDEHLNQTDLELWAGFVGLQQDKKNFALTPQIAWMIKKKETDSTLLVDQFESQKKLGRGSIAIRVKEVPAAIFGLKEIKHLEIAFIDDIHIPERLAKIKIEKLTLSGNITAEEVERIKKLFQNTIVVINRKEIE